MVARISMPTEGTPTEGTPTEGTPNEGTPTQGTPNEGTPTQGQGEYQVRINIIGAGEAINVIESWALEDNYYGSMKPEKSVAGEVNQKARGYPYIQSSEGKTGTMVVKTAVPIEGPLNIVYLDGRSDSGLPHTRGRKGIALPVFLLWDPRPNTLNHEIVHLSQKQFKERWFAFYRQKWSFELATEVQFTSVPLKWRARRRINPDTLGSPYVVWKGRFIPLAVFVSDISPDLKKCKRGFWDLEMSQWTWEVPPGWVEMFGSGFNDEHPNEIAAHWIDGSAGVERRRFFHLNHI